MKLEKATKLVKSTEKRRYDDACGTALGLDLVGERWALLVIRELMLGAKRFSELRGDLPGISANVLTQRLEGLEATGIVVKRKLPPPSGAQVYELTSWGYEAEPLIQELGRWAVRSPLHDPGMPISATSILLSFRTMLDPERAKSIDARIGFRFGEHSFVGHLQRGQLPIERGDPGSADVVFSGSPQLLAAVVYGGQALDLVEVTGDRSLAEKFITLFPLPPKLGPMPVAGG